MTDKYFLLLFKRCLGHKLRLRGATLLIDVSLGKVIFLPRQNGFCLCCLKNKAGPAKLKMPGNV